MQDVRFGGAWDVIVFLLLLPLLAVMAWQLPGDWENHCGTGLPGTATVTVAEPFRSGIHILVDVTDETGQIVARGQEVNGDSPQVMGASFRVQYLPPDGEGATQVYVAGHDPFMVNLLVLVPCLLAWLASTHFMGARLVRLARGVFRKSRPAPSGSYRVGQGYTRE